MILCTLVEVANIYYYLPYLPTLATSIKILKNQIRLIKIVVLQKCYVWELNSKQHLQNAQFSESWILHLKCMKDQTRYLLPRIKVWYLVVVKRTSVSYSVTRVGKFSPIWQFFDICGNLLRAH